MDQWRDELAVLRRQGQEPVQADKRVRQAMYQAIDMDAIKAKVMRGIRAPAGLDHRAAACTATPRRSTSATPYDVDAAKKLLADAGYPKASR